jgi:hypothetical protein
MAKTIEELYEEIAKMMNEAIPEEWARAWATVELAGESALDMIGRYETTDSSAPRTFLIPPPMVRDLAELRRRMKRPGEAAWRKAVFNLTPDGQFHLDLEY